MAARWEQQVVHQFHPLGRVVNQNVLSDSLVSAWLTGTEALIESTNAVNGSDLCLVALRQGFEQSPSPPPPFPWSGA